MTDRPADQPTARPSARGDDDDRPVLPTRPERDSDDAWGDEPARRDATWYRRERPPHHG